jgi:hypothetical protein
MAFLVHTVTTLVTEDLVIDLGIETEQSPMAKSIKRRSSWNITNVEGVYVAVTLARQFQTSLLRWHMV